MALELKEVHITNIQDSGERTQFESNYPCLTCGKLDGCAAKWAEGIMKRDFDLILSACDKVALWARAYKRAENG